MNGEMNQSADEHPGAKEQNSIETILAYHRRTKHHMHRFAASPGYLDWATQPDPFRTYIGAERVDLPLLADRLDAAYAELYFPGAVRSHAAGAEQRGDAVRAGPGTVGLEAV